MNNDIAGYLLCGMGALALWIINDTRAWLKSISTDLKNHVQDRKLHTYCNDKHE